MRILISSKFKSYMKIVRLPYSSKLEVIISDLIEGVLKDLHLFKDAVLASKPHVIKVLPKSNKAVVWVDIWDSQSGSYAKNIINHRFNVGQFIATVCETNMNPEVSQCKNCWKCVVATTCWNGTCSMLTSAKLSVSYLVVGITRELNKEPSLYYLLYI